MTILYKIFCIDIYIIQYMLLAQLFKTYNEQKRTFIKSTVDTEQKRFLKDTNRKNIKGKSHQ